MAFGNVVGDCQGACLSNYGPQTTGFSIKASQKRLNKFKFSQWDLEICFSKHTRLFLYTIKFESTKILGTLAIIQSTNYDSRGVGNCK